MHTCHNASVGGQRTLVGPGSPCSEHRECGSWEASSLSSLGSGKCLYLLSSSYQPWLSPLPPFVEFFGFETGFACVALTEVAVWVRLKHRDPPASALRALGLKVCAMIAWLNVIY